MPSIGLQLRAGVHPGECEAIGDDLGGIAVHIGARISAVAGPNEVLVSQTVKETATGSGISFDERGAHDLKGVPGRRTLCRGVLSLTTATPCNLLRPGPNQLVSDPFFGSSG